MEKYIVRTINQKVAVYVQFGKSEAGQLMEAQSMKFPVNGPFGARSRKSFEAEHNLDGWTFMGLEAVQEKRAIPLSVFMENAFVVDEKL